MSDIKSEEIDNKKEKLFGQRFLNNDNVVFEHNAWDNVEWSEENEIKALKTIKNQKATAVKNAEDLENLAANNWDNFYNTHDKNFFMDRNWVIREFPEIFDAIKEGKKVCALDVGCGVGNTTFPLLHSTGENLFIYCCDFSHKAIDLIKKNDNYNSNQCYSFVWDITEDLTKEIDLNSLDFILCIYVLSALPAKKHKKAIENLTKLLKPNGIIFVKDYALYDLTQLRFKSNRYICDNFYCRGDGTLVYFFSQDELHKLFDQNGLLKIQNHLDKRLLVNRAKQIKMYRRWIQCKYIKPAQ